MSTQTEQIILTSQRKKERIELTANEDTFATDEISL
jgi:hypothetical protein